MADDEARARRTTKAAGPAKKATARKAATPPAAKKAATPTAAKAAAKKAAPAAKKAAPAKRPAAAPPEKAAPGARKRGAILAPRPKKAPAFRVAAEETMEDDWEPPAPEPPREDPHARIRAVLRDAARQVEGRPPAPAASPAAPRPTPASPVPAARPAPPPAPEEVTRVLVAPAPLEEDEWLPDEEVEDEGHVEEEEVEDWDTEPEGDDEEDWSPPEILEEEGGMRTIVSAPASRLSSTAPPPPPPPPPPTEVPPPPPPPPSPATDFTPPPFESRPAPAKRGRSGLKKVLVVLLGLVVLAAVVAGGIWAYKTFVDEGIDYSELKVGDCFDSSASNEIRGIKVKPCAEKHNSEIFVIVTHPAGPSEAYPGKDTLVQYAADNCLGQPLTDYLGVPLEQSKLKDFEIVPQESAWKDGRRALVCGLDTGGQGDITGSVKGTRR